MIIARAVLGYNISETGHLHQSHTLITVDPLTATDHAVDVNTGADPGPRTTPNSTPLRRVVVRTVMELDMVQLAPAVPVSSIETDMVGQWLWEVNLEN